MSEQQTSTRPRNPGRHFRVEATHSPNCLTFEDEKGVKHDVHVPKGTNLLVCDYFIASDWEALKKLPAFSRDAPEMQYDYMDHLKDFDMKAYQALETAEEREKFWREYIADYTA